MDDASDEVINRRISTYEAETKPILDYYSDELVTEIDASQAPAKVLHDILSKMMSLPVYEEMAKVKV